MLFYRKLIGFGVRYNIINPYKQASDVVKFFAYFQCWKLIYCVYVKCKSYIIHKSKSYIINFPGISFSISDPSVFNTVSVRNNKNSQNPTMKLPPQAAKTFVLSNRSNVPSSLSTGKTLKTACFYLLNTNIFSIITLTTNLYLVMVVIVVQNTANCSGLIFISIV